MAPLQELAEVRFWIQDRRRPLLLRARRHTAASRRHPRPTGVPGPLGISRRDTRRVRIVRDGANVEHLVERRFLERSFTSLMEVKRAVVRRGDVGRMVVNASVPGARLRRTHFADYVAYAERQGWHTGSTISSRARTRPWYTWD